MKSFSEFVSQKKVFLGGTCNESQWREKLIPLLKIDYFNPVVPDWTEEAYQEELRQRELCDYCLYVITPKMTGVYSIAEAVDDSNKCPSKTVFAFLLDEEDGENMEFSSEQLKSLDKVGEMISFNGGVYIRNRSYETIANYLNGEYYI